MSDVKSFFDDWGYDINSPFYEGDGGDDPLADDGDDDDYDQYEDDELKAIEKIAFGEIPKHGIHAHAYKKELDNIRIKKLWEKGNTYRQIAKQLKCSPSTVRNRLKKLEAKDFR